MSEQPGRRTRMVPVRMTDAEHADATACASALGISLSRLLRSRGEALPPARIDLEAAGQLARIGNTLNQIARQLNAGQGVDTAHLQVALTELREEVADIRGRLRT